MAEAARDPAEERELARRRAAGEPLQYVLGRWQFRSLELVVDPRVLIPRPETEWVVEVALREMRSMDRRVGASERGRAAGGDAGDPGGVAHGGEIVAVDLGTGSGAIALSLATECSRSVRIIATERSPAALEVASLNLAACDPEVASRVELLYGSWFDPVPGDLRGRVQLVVSNPPYVAAWEWPELPAEVRDWEPYDALVPGETGLEAIAAILSEAGSWLAPGGVVVIECAPGQRDAVLALAAGAGFSAAQVIPDLSGRPRVMVARVPVL